MKPVAITETLSNIESLYNQLSDSEKIQRDNDGIQIFEINRIDGTDLATLIYVPVKTRDRVRTLKQPRIRDLHNKLIAINKESFYLSHIDDIRKAGDKVEVVDREGKVLYSASPLAVSRWLTRTEKQNRIKAWALSEKRQGTDY